VHLLRGSEQREETLLRGSVGHAVGALTTPYLGPYFRRPARTKRRGARSATSLPCSACAQHTQSKVPAQQAPRRRRAAPPGRTREGNAPAKGTPREETKKAKGGSHQPPNPQTPRAQERREKREQRGESTPPSLHPFIPSYLCPHTTPPYSTQQHDAGIMLCILLYSPYYLISFTPLHTSCAYMCIHTIMMV
jgi:hypothetical protein